MNYKEMLDKFVVLETMVVNLEKRIEQLEFMDTDFLLQGDLFAEEDEVEVVLEVTEASWPFLAVALDASEANWPFPNAKRP